MTCLFNAVFPTATFAGDTFMQAWLSLEALQIWLAHGTARGLVGPASYSAATAIALRDDYGAAYRAARRIVAVGEARGYEPETSLARFVSSYFGCWFEPLEIGVAQAKRAREGLIKGGDLAPPAIPWRTPPGGDLISCPTLDIYVAEAEKALAFVRRSASNQWGSGWRPTSGWQMRCAAKPPTHPVGWRSIDRYADDSAVPFYGDLSRAIAATIFDDPTSLRHTPPRRYKRCLLPSATM